MAKRFNFRLGQVLSLRKQIEDVRVRELAQAKSRLLEIENALRVHAEIEGKFFDTYEVMEEGRAFNVDEAIVYSNYKEWLRRKEAEYKGLESEWALEVERRRREAVKASKQRQLLENFKEKQERKHEKEVLNEEQKFLDEISSIAFLRRERSKRAVGDR
jgi:flagellar export protein FliJ